MLVHAARVMLVTVLAASILSGPIDTRAYASTAWPLGSVHVRVEAQRVAGPDRYATSVAIASEAFPGWQGITHVVIASGEDRAVADPLAAAGLCWAYDAPLLLVRGDSVPAAVASAIASMPEGVRIVVVGGTRTIPDARLQELARIRTVSGVERVLEAGDRYALAATVALRMRAVADADPDKTMPGHALLANGQDATTFFDAMALSALSAGTGAPVLLLTRDAVPSATSEVLRSLGLTRRIVAGGYRTVSSRVVSALAAERWAGADRYASAAEISRRAIANGWASDGYSGLASQLPDALSGAALIGSRGGTLLLTDAANLPPGTASVLAGRASSSRVAVLGGSRSITDSVLAELRGAPARPAILSPSTSTYVAKRGRLIVRTGVNTSEIRIYHGDRHVATRGVTSFAHVDLGVADVPFTVPLRVVAGNPDGGRAVSEVRLRRLAYPASTSIVVDKSDFRLYWVKNDVLIEAYPVGIGRTNAETPPATWMIKSKYYPDPSSVYGPRKMRLYRKVGSSYVYTAYNIHGTNQPWAIGTKVSAGCIRMYNHDVLELFPQVPLGTIVVTRE